MQECFSVAKQKMQAVSPRENGNGLGGLGYNPPYQIKKHPSATKRAKTAIRFAKNAQMRNSAFPKKVTASNSPAIKNNKAPFATYGKRCLVTFFGKGRELFFAFPGKAHGTFP